MRFQTIRWALVAAPMFFMTANANGQVLWEDNFDSYANGSLIEYQGGWTGWALSGPGPSMVSNAQSNSGPHSGEIISGSDTVYHWDGDQGGVNEPAPDCGEWTFTGQVFVPSGGQGQNLAILFNSYDGLGSAQWAVQVSFNMNTGMAFCFCGTAGPQATPLVLDQWAEFRVEVDLDVDPFSPLDNASVYYDGILLGSYVWSNGVVAQSQYTELKVAALDLYPLPGSSSIFWDDFRLEKTGSGNCAVGTNYCSSTVNSTGSASTISAAGSASIAANDLVLTANSLPTQPGIFIAGPGQTQLPFFNGFLCVHPNGLQRFANTTAPMGGLISEAVDYATSAPGGLMVVAGSSFNYQRWNRDPAGGGANANFSDGLEITHTP